jgi:hypothetical protein
MVSFRDGVGNTVGRVSMEFIDVGVKIKKGFMHVGEATSYAMYDIYSLDGFEKWTKVAIADLRFLSLIPSINGVFDECLKTLEGQKDLIYGSLVFSSTAEFIKKTKNTDGETHYSFQIPTAKEKNAQDVMEEHVDWVKVLNGIGNFFETGKFLNKYKVMSFPLCSQLATQFGSIPVFGKTTIGDIPVINCWCSKPRDFFVFIASGYTAYKCYDKPSEDFRSTENLIKLSGNIGKLILIGGGDWMLSRKYFWTVAVVDVLTQNASLIGYFLKREREREARFEDPTRF